MRQFYHAKIQLKEELEKIENTRQNELIEGKYEKKDEEIQLTKIIPPQNEGEKCRKSSHMNNFTKEQIMNSEQLTDETINLALKILKNEHPSWNGLKILPLDLLENTAIIERIFSKFCL